MPARSSAAQVRSARGETGWHAGRIAGRAGPVGGGYRFLPNGTGLVYLPRIQSLDFWLLDFATKTTRQLTRLEQSGRSADVRHHA